MLPFLAAAARSARENAGRLQVHIAASANVTESVITRFEARRAWPRDPDRIIGAYADDLDVHPVEIWERAAQLWRDSTDAAQSE